MTALILWLLAAPFPVTDVVLYPDRAQVTRTAEVTCGARVPVSFTEVAPAADPGSFRARSSAGKVEGLTSSVRTRDEAFAPTLRKLEEDLHALSVEMTALREAQSRARERDRLSARYGELAAALAGREMGEGPANPKGWAAAFDVALQGRKEAAQAALDAQVKLRELERRQADLVQKRARIAAAPDRKDFTVDVVVSCPAGGRARVELTYLVGGASWSPEYEARLGDGGGVELSTFATLRQSTGEPWTHARLTLSTAVPRQDATPPEPQPLRVWADERKEPKKVLVRRDEEVRHAQVAQPGGAGGEEALSAQDQGVSVQLQVGEPADVPDDATPVRVFVGRQRLPGRLALRSAPRLQPFFFRVVELANAAPYPLLPGPIDTYRAGDFIARAALEHVPRGARFELTFGLEDGLRIRRTVLEEVERESGLFGSHRRFRYAYRLEVESFRSGPEDIEVTEQIPVSELDDVKVAVDPRTTPGHEVLAEEGLVRWRLKLGKGRKQELTLAFHVDVPASYETGGP